MLKSRSSLAMLVALAAASAASVPGPTGATRTTARRKSVFKPMLTTDQQDKRTAQQREIDEWNAAVDARKAEKRRLRSA